MTHAELKGMANDCRKRTVPQNDIYTEYTENVSQKLFSTNCNIFTIVMDKGGKLWPPFLPSGHAFGFKMGRNFKKNI